MLCEYLYEQLDHDRDVSLLCIDNKDGSYTKMLTGYGFEIAQCLCEMFSECPAILREALELIEELNKEQDNEQD